MVDKELTEKQRIAIERKFIGGANKEELATEFHQLHLRIPRHLLEQVERIAKLTGHQRMNSTVIEILWAGIRGKLVEFGEI